MHVHIYCGDGEAKFWLEPQIELARNYRLSQSRLREIEEHYDGLRTAWQNSFGR